MKTTWQSDVWQGSRTARSLVGALDQGTSSTRFVVFTQSGQLLASAQLEHEQLYPQQGWHEHNPLDLITNSLACMEGVQKLFLKHTNMGKKVVLQALGITNQRETTLAWNKLTGVPYYNAIVWDDARTSHIAASLGDINTLRAATGLPLSSYFSGTKVKWLIDNVPELRADLTARPDQVCFGTVDTWLVYQLTGQPSNVDGALNCQGQFTTDVTNASRWLFLNLATQQWDERLVAHVCAPHQVPLSTLPTVGPSARNFGTVQSAALGSVSALPMLENVPIAAVLGDQQAALFGQTAFSAGQAKNTYGTGLFLMMNTGPTPISSTHGLLTTIAYQMENEPVIYALEGSVAHAGSTIQWLRDKLQIIDAAPDTEDLATETNDGLYFVPAFGGLFCPHWRADARACLVGLTAGHHKGHVCRAALEAAAYQTREVLEAMQADAGITLDTLKVDGGASANRLLMQFQADILHVPVVQPVVMETTSLGAAFAAGLTVGVWESQQQLSELWAIQHTFTPQMLDGARQKYFGEWKKAVSKSLGWVEENMPKENKSLVKKLISLLLQETSLVAATATLVVGFVLGRMSMARRA